MSPLLTTLYLAVAPVLAAAPEDDISNSTLGIVMAIGGVIVALFSGSRAEQQGGRLGMGEGGIKKVKLVYILMGVAMSVAGVLVATGVIVPATAAG